MGGHFFVLPAAKVLVLVLKPSFAVLLGRTILADPHAIYIYIYIKQHDVYSF